MQTSISSVKEGGKLIELMDGTKWAVNSFDMFHTQMWMIMDKIETAANSLTNLSRGDKKVSATQLR